MNWIVLGFITLLFLAIGSLWAYSKLYPFVEVDSDCIQGFLDYAINSKPFHSFLQRNMEDFEISGHHIKACWNVTKLEGPRGPVHLQVWLQRSDGKRRTRKWLIYLNDEEHFYQVREAITKLRDTRIRERSSPSEPIFSPIQMARKPTSYNNQKHGRSCHLLRPS